MAHSRSELRLFLFIVACTNPAGAAEEELPVLAEGAKPRMLQEKGAGEGPAWHPELGLLTSGDGHINRRDSAGKQSIFRRDAGSNGLLFDRQGRLVICEPRLRRVTRLDTNGQLEVLAENYDGQAFNQPNDVAIDSRGRIYSVSYTHLRAHET